MVDNGKSLIIDNFSKGHSSGYDAEHMHLIPGTKYKIFNIVDNTIIKIVAAVKETFKLKLDLKHSLTICVTPLSSQ